MGLAHAGIAVENIASIPEYVDLFKKAFPGEAKPVTYDNIARAIGDFERTLTTPGRFDKYLAGDVAALERERAKGAGRVHRRRLRVVPQGSPLRRR